MFPQRSHGPAWSLPIWRGPRSTTAGVSCWYCRMRCLHRRSNIIANLTTTVTSARLFEGLWFVIPSVPATHGVRIRQAAIGPVPCRGAGDDGGAAQPAAVAETACKGLAGTLRRNSLLSRADDPGRHRTRPRTDRRGMRSCPFAQEERRHPQSAGGLVRDQPVREPSEHPHEAEFAAGSLVVVELCVRVAHLVYHRQARAEALPGEGPVVDGKADNGSGSGRDDSENTLGRRDRCCGGR